MANAKLAPIPRSDWRELRDLYRCDWPTNQIGFYTVDTFLQWTERKGDIDDLVMYSLDGDWKSDGTFVCIHRNQMFANTLDPDLDRLQRLLNILNWSSDAYTICALYTRFRPAVQAIVDADRMTVEYDSHTLLYHMPQELAIQQDVTCPPGLTLRSLNAEQDTETINDAWPNRHDGSLLFLKQVIELNTNVGVFDENDQLVAWCLRWQAGTYGALQVLDTHQRRGLGLLACKALSKKLAELGYDSCASVEHDNAPSRRTFERAGFRVIDEVHRIYTRPSSVSINE